MWTMHTDEVLGELLERLDAMGVAPLGAVERAPMLVEKRTWTRTFTDAGSDNVEAALENAIQAHGLW
jgi:hypothetical protein